MSARSGMSVRFKEPMTIALNESSTHIYALCGCGAQFHEYGKDASANYRKWLDHPCPLKEQRAGDAPV